MTRTAARGMSRVSKNCHLEAQDAGANIPQLRRNLLKWFARHGRDLPWRRTRDPYGTWVSEIMLQQTTVAAVVPYFERFLEAFPTASHLARADEHDVMRLWAGLGYYSRARNLHRAARQIVEKHAGQIPDNLADLQGLPGIGRYTAGAIVSLAYDRPAAIVEANTQRVYSRLLALDEDLRASAGRERIWAFAERAVPAKLPGAFNQALMDLGALVCTPVDPKCPACPIRSCCEAFRRGLQHAIPRKRPRPQPTLVTQAMIAVRNGDQYLLRKGPEGERWAGLWEFLRVPAEIDAISPENGPRRGGELTLSRSVRRRLARFVSAALGIEIEPDAEAFDFYHTVTRFRIRLICATAHYIGGTWNSAAETAWIRPGQFDERALSTPALKFATRLAEAAGCSCQTIRPLPRGSHAGRGSKTPRPRGSNAN